MKRLFENKLLDWKQSGMNKPLMVVGARQVGKTYIIENFCKNNFEKYLYFNLEKNLEVKNIFEKTIDESKIIEELELIIGEKIDIEKTIFFFDEIQESENFIVSLKYFNESSKPYKIICAGSLLGVKISRFKSSFPVGKIRMEYMYPMNFEEFLIASGKEILRNKIIECFNTMSPMPDFAHEQALTLYKQYLCVGGMPEAVKNLLVNDKNILRFDKSIIEDIYQSYLSDMNKHIDNKFEASKIERIYKSIPSQLGNQSNKFQYGKLSNDARKRDFAEPLNWLLSSTMIHKCVLLNKVEIPPLGFVIDDHFKLYLSDVGILLNMLKVKYNDVILDNLLQYKGIIAENYVATQLVANHIPLIYWKSGNKAKVDFILYNDEGIIPIEVKANDNVNSQSLSVYIKRYKPKYAIRISTKNFGYSNNIKSIPLYATFLIK